MKVHVSSVIIQVLGWIFDPDEGCDARDLELLGLENNRYLIGER